MNRTLGLTLALTALATVQSVAQAQDSRVIEEVIVTANKRAESLQDISSAVTALGGDVLETLNLEDFYDVADMTPGMAQRTEDEITIRGVGRIGGDASFASTVAVHENGFFLPRGAYWPFLDIAAVEITRGPSGAVFGRNATGGAVNVKWREPGEDFGGWADATLGNYNFRRIRGALDIPLSSDGRLLSRIAYMNQERDGTLDNILLPSDLDGHNRDESLARATVQFAPTENITATLRYMLWQRDKQYTYGRPSDHTYNSGFYESVGADRPPRDRTKVESNIRDYHEGVPGDNRDERLDADLDWFVGTAGWFGDVSINLNLGRHENDRRRVTDLDGSTTDIVSADQTAVGYTNNAELRLTTTSENGLDLMFGIFWAEFFEDYSGSYITATVPVGVATLLLPFPAPIDPTIAVKAVLDHKVSDQYGESRALFGNATLRLQSLWSELPNVELFGGYRTNDDDVALFSILQTDVFIPPESPVPATSETSLVDIAQDFTQDTWELGTKWYINDSHMWYLKRAKGYKAGAIEFAGGELNRVRPEILQSWETGLKSSFLDRSLQVNLAAFHYDYSDLQVLVHVGVETRTENAANSEMTGVELELQWQPTAAFSTMLTAAYVDARFTDYCTTDPTFPQGYTDPACMGQEGERDLSDNRLPNAPPRTLALVSSYTFDLGAAGTLQPLLKVVWADEFYTSANNIGPYRIEQATQTDFRLIWRSQSQQWTVDAYVEHIENDDDRYSMAISTGLPDGLFYFGQVPPRMIGVRVAYEF